MGTADPRGDTINETAEIPGFATEIDATEVKEGGTDGQVGASSRSYSSTFSLHVCRRRGFVGRECVVNCNGWSIDWFISVGGW